MVIANYEKCASVYWDDYVLFGFIQSPEEHARILVDAINSLPLTCRQVVILFTFGEMTRYEIAGRLGISVEAVRFLVHRGGIGIRKYLTEFADSDPYVMALERKSSYWPWHEYAELAQLQKQFVFCR